jgi:hypothetical protein
VERFHDAGGARDLVLEARARNLSISNRPRVSAVSPGGDSTLRETGWRQPPLALSASLPRSPALSRADRFRSSRTMRPRSRISHVFRVAQLSKFGALEPHESRDWSGFLDHEPTALRSIARKAPRAALKRDLY